ncbi:zinc metalloprotease HtpX [Methanosarcina mazei]|uniref:Protease HtpX homolog n=1 Tax=Methanosarcina mazei TaxID=2209 RepID=A0A0F8MA23_METMZ|nr:zinc metalloprotease HtpX [Methanosarcina mazei]KKG56701.1 protease HtpX [Methanosarcina mazei]KKG61647.1 protease HtpX [Methanosarcina mazei]KKG64417.1 protease HtpX [Methanosarcina mazei]KKG99306.1 protease HtpX [Methanosarcina mazei]KKH00299.1 protease HtpX [Methanosarcina mazei]
MKNVLKTTVLLAALTGLLVIIGDYFGGTGGMIIAFLFAVVLNFGSYWYSDKIVLKMYRAKEVSPAEAPNLHRIVDGLVMKAGIPKPKVYIVQSGMPNAFATGRDPKHAAVAATTGILELLSYEEMEGVLAHELAHVKNRDTLISAIAATLAGVVTMLAHWAQWAAIFGGFGGRDDDGNGGIVGLIAMAIVAPIAATLIQLAISRSREFAADEEGARISRKPWALADALEKLEYGNSHYRARVSDVQAKESSAHMFIVNPLKGGAVQSLFRTHPVTDERVKRLRAMKF